MITGKRKGQEDGKEEDVGEGDGEMGDSATVS